jgi:hypothetical protein
MALARSALADDDYVEASEREKQQLAEAKRQLEEAKADARWSSLEPLLDGLPEFKQAIVRCQHQVCENETWLLRYKGPGPAVPALVLGPEHDFVMLRSSTDPAVNYVRLRDAFSVPAKPELALQPLPPRPKSADLGVVETRGSSPLVAELTIVSLAIAGNIGLWAAAPNGSASVVIPAAATVSIWPLVGLAKISPDAVRASDRRTTTWLVEASGGFAVLGLIVGGVSHHDATAFALGATMFNVGAGLTLAQFN